MLKIKNYYSLVFSLILLFIFTIFAWLNIDKGLEGIDDANIYFVYMKNLANGFGFVYNKNSENVEGFTSLLWTLLGGFLIFINLKINIVLIFINIFLLFLFVRKSYKFIASSNLIPFFFYFFIFSSSGFVEWNILSLLETGLWTFLIAYITLILLLDETHDYKIILFLCLLIFTRPESLILVPFFFFTKIIFDIINRNFNINEILKIAFFIIINYLVLFSYRIYFFNSLFPNTYYAKLGSNTLEEIFNGILYIKIFLKQNIVYLIIILLAFLRIIKIIMINRIKENKEIIFLICLIFLSFFIALVVGGDHFGLYRFFQPFIIIYALLFLYTINDLKINKNYVFILAILISTITSNNNFYKIYKSKYSPAKIEWTIVAINKNQALFLNRMFDNKLPKIGVLAAGAMAYNYNGFSIDLLGLNNVLMARSQKNPIGPKNHASFNKEIFYKQKPDIIIANIITKSNENIKVPMSLGSWEKRLLNNIDEDNYFNNLYSKYIVFDTKTNLSISAYMLDEFVTNLSSSRYKVTKF